MMHGRKNIRLHCNLSIKCLFPVLMQVQNNPK